MCVYRLPVRLVDPLSVLVPIDLALVIDIRSRCTVILINRNFGVHPEIQETVRVDRHMHGNLHHGNLHDVSAGTHCTLINQYVREYLTRQ